jgi:hypothetical protein
MEQPLAGKPTMAITNGLRALLPVFQKHYGDPEGFRSEGADVARKEMGDIPGGAEPTGRFLLALYQQVLRTRAGYFRPIESQAALDSAYRELTARSAEDGPLRQGVLWLGHRLQQAAIQYLSSNRAEQALASFLKAVRERRQAIRGKLGDPAELDLDRMEAVLGEMGMEVPDPVLCNATDPNNPETTVSPAGFVFNPELDDIERPPVCDPNADGDGDGVTNEVDPALVDHMEFYLLNYFKPGRYEVTARAQQGEQLMDSIGCTGCHTQDLTIDNDRRVADVETAYDPANGIFNDMFASASTLFHTEDDGNEFPLIVPDQESFVVENFFSDLRRHDLGPEFHERDYDGSLVTEFVTEPLWGVGTSAPYGHDGRSINLDQVIRRHGGEALQARQAYEGLSDDERRMILEFLRTLVLFPPDDTASDLNPGNPATNNPQNPSEHGTINLGALFQIPSEGPE